MFLELQKCVDLLLDDIGFKIPQSVYQELFLSHNLPSSASENKRGQSPVQVEALETEGSALVSAFSDLTMTVNHSG